MPDINHVSVTFHDERKREEYGPMKKAEATITATVAAGEDGAIVLDAIAFIATNKVRALLSIEGATAPQAASAAAAPDANAAVARSTEASQAAPGEHRQPPPTRIRRTADEVARGLTVEQAAAERDARAAAPASDTSASATDASTASAEATPGLQPSSVQSPASASNEWDGPAPVVITDAELNAACSEAATRCGDPTKVRALKEPYNPQPGQPFTFTQIPQQHRAEVLAKLAAL